MKSNRNSDDLDLDHDLPTRPEDVEALRRHRPGGMPFDEFLRFSQRMCRLSAQELRARKGPRGEPFTL